MIKGIPRISVYIITYNQEDVIDRTLGSILNQLDYVYEICVSDDCSSDRTWNVLNEYAVKYPGLFKLNRNDPNLGIFENTEKVWTMPTGDIVHDLAGDDSVGEGWFKKVVDFIMENKIDYKNEHFCIYGDYKAVYPNGDAFVARNNMITTGRDPFSLSLRKLIGNRSCCYSIGILKKFINVSQGRSYAVEASQDRQLQIFTEKNYYINYVGNIYYARIGVSNNQMRALEIRREREDCMNSLRTMLRNVSYKPTAVDDKYMLWIEAKDKTYRINTVAHKFKVLQLYFQSRDMSIGLKTFNLKRILFAIVRRLPHSSPISWTI